MSSKVLLVIGGIRLTFDKAWHDSIYTSKYARPVSPPRQSTRALRNGESPCGFECETFRTLMCFFILSVCRCVLTVPHQWRARTNCLWEVGGWGRVPFSRISWNLRPVVNGTWRRAVGFIKWYSTPSPNLSPYILLGLDPSPPPLAFVFSKTFCNTKHPVLEKLPQSS